MITTVFFASNTQNLIRCHLQTLLLAATAFALTACSPQEKYPESYGLFLWNGTTWADVSAEKTTTTLEIVGDAKFLLHDKQIAQLSSSFIVNRKFFMRNEIHQETNGSNRVIAKSIKLWDLKEKPDAVPGRLFPVKDRPEMVIWKPDSPLSSGIYQPWFSRKPGEAFVVDKSVVLANLEASPFCVDRILTKKFMWDNPIPAQYAACTESGANVGKAEPHSPTSQTNSATEAKLAKYKTFETAIYGDGGGQDLEADDEVAILMIDKKMPTPKQLAAALPYVAAHGKVNLVTRIIDSGISVTPFTTEDGQFVNPLVGAGSVDVAKLLISRGAQINTASFNGETPLISAAGMNRKDLVQYLLSVGADPEIQDRQGLTAIAVAKGSQAADAVAVLAAHRVKK